LALHFSFIACKTIIIILKWGHCGATESALANTCAQFVSNCVPEDELIKILLAERSKIKQKHLLANAVMDANGHLWSPARAPCHE
jgi:hypothetical protein